MMVFAKLITRMTEAAVRGDGVVVVGCFTPDGIYNDVFYGAFAGAEIKDLIESHFHRDGERFRWDIFDPVSDGTVGYARYLFSYDSKLAGSVGKRAIFEGVAICRLADDRIASYSEVANAATGLICLGQPAERIAGFIARQTRNLRGREEAVLHGA